MEQTRKPAAKNPTGKRNRRGAIIGRGRGGRVLTIVAALAVASVLIGLTAAPVAAQGYPNKPLHLILPFPPGGATDILGRIVGQLMSERLGQPLVPENRPGAAGNIGSEIAAKSKPDGYTVLLAGPALTISPGLYKKMNYDPAKDLAPIAQILVGHYVMLVRPSLPVKSLQELVAYAKSRPGKLNFGSGGLGTPNHLAAELFKMLAKVDMIHVPYKGVNQAMVGMMSDEVDMVIIGTPAALPQIKAGKVRPLAVLSEQRLPSLPEVPTTKEAGIDNFEVLSWYGLLVPAGTPAEVITRLNAEWTRLAALPDTREKMAKVGFEPMASTPAQFGGFIQKEIDRWTRVIREGNIATQ